MRLQDIIYIILYVTQKCIKQGNKKSFSVDSLEKTYDLILESPRECPIVTSVKLLAFWK